MEAVPTPKRAGEKQTLRAILEQNRAVLIWKLAGMDDERARLAPFASDTSAIGLLQHLTIVERSWFEEIFAGREVTYEFDFEADIDAEWHLSGSESLFGAIEAYEAQAAISADILEEADLDDLSAQERGNERYSLRWIVVHMIEETARHLGHADVLREHIDGTLGYLPEM